MRRMDKDMNTGKAILKNSSMGLVTQVLQIAIQFITRAVFVRFIGIEVLGISVTCASVLNTLSLTELGFQTAIVYNLYKPLRYGDNELINDIINIFKLVYRVVGIFIGAASLVCLPFIGSIMKGVEMTPFVYAIFLMHVADTMCSYFLAYKRALLYADQREYVSRSIDALLNIFISIVKIAVLIVTKQYLLYLAFQIAQTILSNCLVHAVCRRYYPYLHKEAINRGELKHIWGNVKNIFLGKLAGYVYGSTDNLVISAMVGTVSVGFMTNYLTILQSVKGLCMSVLAPLAPIIGNMLAQTDDNEDRERGFLLFTHARYLIAAMVVIPLYLLIDEVISVWVGAEFLLERVIVMLLAADFYIDLVHSACCDYITGAGLFKEERNIELAGALLNLGSSIAFTFVMGIKGVLLGTFISQLFFWISRSIVVYRYCFKMRLRALAEYAVKNLYMVLIVIADIAVAQFVYSHITLESFIPRFLAGGIICEIIFAASYMILLMPFWEQRSMIKEGIGIVKRGVAAASANMDPNRRKRKVCRKNKSDKPVYIIRRYQKKEEMSGFFSNYFYVLGHIIQAEKQGMKCVVDMQNYKTCYSEDALVNGTSNAWEYYFEQPYDITLHEAYASENYILSNDRYQFGIVPNYSVDGGLFPDREMVEKLTPYVRENMKIKPYITEKADKMMSGWENLRILGIHVRGTDMRNFPGHPEPPSLEEYMKAADSALSDADYDKIFLCTDEDAAIKAFEQKYGSRLIKSDAFRSTDGTALHTSYENTERKHHRYQLGAEVLIDAILLSHCTAIICGHSNVPYAAIVMNGNKYERIILLDNHIVE